MTEKPKENTSAFHRNKRLAQELRANLMKRKQQVRARREGEADQRNEGMPVMNKASASKADDRNGDNKDVDDG